MLDLRKSSLGLRRARNPGQEKSWQDLVEWLYEAIPVIVMRWMLVAKAVKVCSVISPVFASIAKANGFDAWIDKKPGHVFNVVMLSDCDAMVDLSAIQFEYDSDGEDGTYDYVLRETDRLLAEVRDNPFAAAKVVRTEKKDSHDIDTLTPPYEDPVHGNEGLIRLYNRTAKNLRSFLSGEGVPDCTIELYGGVVGRRIQPTSAGLPTAREMASVTRRNPRRLGR